MYGQRDANELLSRLVSENQGQAGIQVEPCVKISIKDDNLTRAPYQSNLSFGTIDTKKGNTPPVGVVNADPKRVLSLPKVLVYVDPDIDGVVAGRLLMSWLAGYSVGFSWYVNPNRSHGFFLTDDQLRKIFNTEDLSDCWVIHGDFTIPEEQLKHLTEDLGLNVVSTDHHELPPNQEYIRVKSDQGLLKGIVLNNQYGFENPDHRYQSGAGVVLDMLRNFEGLDWGGQEAEALVGWSLLSDVRDISSNEAHWWLNRLYTWSLKSSAGWINTLNHVITQVVKAGYNRVFGVPQITRNFINFQLSPSINALFRFDLEEQAMELFLGAPYPPCRNNFTWQKLQREVKNAILEESVVTEYGEYLAVLDLPYPRYSGLLNKYNPSNFIGMAASSVSNELGRCVIAICRGPNNEIDRASFRGLYFLEYRVPLNKTGVLHGEGHGAAFGILELSETGFQVGTNGISTRQTSNDEVSLSERRSRVFSKLASVVDDVIHSSPKIRHSSYGTLLTVSNMGEFMVNQASKVARANEFLNNQDQIAVRYTGSGFEISTASANRTVYLLDGVQCVVYAPAEKISDDSFSTGVITVSRGSSGIELVLQLS